MISASMITTGEEYRAKYRGHLCCTTENCPARLCWVNRRDYPHFRTLQTSRHIESCPYAYETDPFRVSYRATSAIPLRITSAHKQRSLDQSLLKQKIDDGLIPRPTSSPTAAKRDRAVFRAGGSHSVASADPTALSPRAGMREPYIHQRNCQQLRPSDHGKYLCVRGIVTEAAIREESVHLFLTNDEDPPVDILFYTPFRISSGQAYSWVTEIARLLIAGKLPPFQLSCIGTCRAKDDGYEITILDPESLLCNQKPLVMFYSELFRLAS